MTVFYCWEFLLSETFCDGLRSSAEIDAAALISVAKSGECSNWCCQAFFAVCKEIAGLAALLGKPRSLIIGEPDVLSLDHARRHHQRVALLALVHFPPRREFVFFFLSWFTKKRLNIGSAPNPTPGPALERQVILL